MGTNYYLHEKPDCECCGRPFEPLHIGKSSAGWHFSLHVIPELGLNTLEDWQKLWSVSGAVILDEYHCVIPPERIIEIITGRSWTPSAKQTQFWFAQNDAEPGLNGLARHRLGGRRCIGHGPGTWDYITGEFS